jgi:ParB/RepB/Spo0J family partition protein
MKTDVRDLDIQLIEKNPWNPNTMSEEGLNRLIQEIEEVGFIDPIQVVPMESGKYRVLGGEHRFEAMLALGHVTIPAVVLTEDKWQDEDLQKLVTVRLNVLKGKLDPARMALLYDEMAKKYGDQALQNLFAYTDKGAYNKMLGSIQRGLKQAGVPQKVQKDFEESAKEAKSVEDIGMILNDMFASYGDTVSQDFMVFTYGGHEHIYIAMDEPLRAAMRKISSRCDGSGESVLDLIGPAIREVAATLKPAKKKRAAKKAIAEEEAEF